MEPGIEAIGPTILVLLYLRFLTNIDEYFAYSFEPNGSAMTVAFNARPLVEDLAQLIILGGRAGADVRYDALVYDPKSGAFSVEGLSVATDQGAVTLGSARISAVSADDPVVDMRIEFDDLTLDPNSVSLPPEVAVQFALLGLETVSAGGALELSYDLQRSDAAAMLSLEVDGLGRAAATVSLAGLHLQRDFEDPGAEPEPRGELVSASISVENRGALDAASALFGGPLDEPSARQLAALASDQLRIFLTGADLAAPGELQAAPTAEAEAFAQSVEDAITRFLVERDSIAISIAPDAPAPLTALEDLERVGGDLNARLELLEALSPRASASPTALRPIIADLAAADGLAAAEALIDGVGAPRNLARAVEILTPLADGGDAAARLALARALVAQDGDAARRAAYAQALQAEADGAPGAAGAAASLAADLPLGERLAVEAEVFDPTGLAELRAAADAGDAAAMRRLGLSYERGDGVARHLAEAYRWAVLAAAAGDAAGLRLRDRLAAGFAHASDAESAIWSTRRAEIDAETLAAWTEGLGARAAAFAER